jgi:long-chain acyl-CoA synthetase
MRTRQDIIAELTAPGAALEVVREHVRGIPMPVYAGGPSSLRAVFESTRQFDDRDFLVYGDERWTYGHHYRLVCGLAHHFQQSFGLRKGDRVAIGMRNYPEWVMTFWACQVLGAIAVPLNAWWTGSELAYAVRDSAATLLVLDDERLERIAGELPGLPSVEHTVSVRTAAAYDGVHRWEDVLASLDRQAELPTVDIAPDDDATILYTSGTTGAPKGAVGSHRNHCTNLMNTMLLGAVAVERAADSGVTLPETPPQPCALQTFPFFHIGGLSGLYVSTAFGSRLVTQYKWDTAEAIDIIEREGVTSMSLVPTLLRRFLEFPGLSERDLSTLTAVASGGAAVPPDLITRIESDFAQRVSPANGYGLTETTSAVVMNSADQYFDHPDSIGRPVPVCELRIVEPGGGDLPTGQIGELLVRGPNVVRGYWNNPVATEAAFTDGWFHSGDLGRVDEDGLVYVLDRLKDVVIRGGENIYCAEVEAVLFEHPAVYDVALIGVPDVAMGEQPLAIVQVRPGTTVTEDELRAFVGHRIARFKVPAHVVFRDDALPRTATGKLLKRQLRDELLACSAPA